MVAASRRFLATAGLSVDNIAVWFLALLADLSLYFAEVNKQVGVALVRQESQDDGTS